MQELNFKPEAFIFDLNGTMINDMDYHTQAWQGIINNELKTPMDFETVKREMYGKNSEVLERIFGADRFTADEIVTLATLKEKRYKDAYLPHLLLIDGLDNFLAKARLARLKLAIGSAAIPSNIDFVLDGLKIRNQFQAVVSANDVETSKPHPETFLKAASLLKTKPENCLVFEDAPQGVACALHAGMRCVVITTAHSKEEFAQYPNILYFIADYNDAKLNTLF